MNQFILDHIPSQLSQIDQEKKTLKIYTFPDSILKKKAQEISLFQEDLKNLALSMLHTMYRAPGIGLAAPQVGVSQRLLVLDVDYKREAFTNSLGQEDTKLVNLRPYIFVNPQIIHRSGEILHREGCLSLPGIYEEVKRAQNIVVEYQDCQGEKHQLEANGLLAICIQHEMDHLEGIVFLDYLSPLKREFFRKKLLKLRKKS